MTKTTAKADIRMFESPNVDSIADLMGQNLDETMLKKGDVDEWEV